MTAEVVGLIIGGVVSLAAVIGQTLADRTLHERVAKLETKVEKLESK